MLLCRSCLSANQSFNGLLAPKEKWSNLCRVLNCIHVFSLYSVCMHFMLYWRMFCISFVCCTVTNLVFWLQQTNKVYHGLRGSASPVLTATGFVNGRGQFSTPTESTLLDRSPKNLLLVITSATPTAVPNLVQIRPRGGFWANGWNITNFYLFIYLFIPFFHELTYRSDPPTDFYAWWSNDADVPFGGFVDIAPHFGGEIPPKPQFLGRE